MFPFYEKYNPYLIEQRRKSWDYSSTPECMTKKVVFGWRSILWTIPLTIGIVTAATANLYVLMALIFYGVFLFMYIADHDISDRDVRLYQFGLFYRKRQRVEIPLLRTLNLSDIYNEQCVKTNKIYAQQLKEYLDGQRAGIIGGSKKIDRQLSEWVSVIKNKQAQESRDYLDSLDRTEHLKALKEFM